MKIKRNSRGFTLIEVVLVLAIGGLIFLLAFLAFQQVSTNRRDTQRRNDAGKIVAELQNYYGDKKAYPAASVAVTDLCTSGGAAGSFQAFMYDYLCGKSSTGFVSPQGSYKGIASGTPVKDEIRYTKDSNCAGGTVGNKIEIGLEKGVVCRDDQ